MKKEEIAEIKMPLSREDYLRLRKGIERCQNDRTDIPLKMRSQMDEHWAEDNEKEYKRLVTNQFNRKNKNFKPFYPSPSSADSLRFERVKDLKCP